MKLVVFGLGMVGLALSVWAMVDALRASDAQWQAIGQKRLLWVASVGAGAFLLGPLGAVFAIFYLVGIRPKLAAARSTGP
jgi:hypothetical protein